MEKKIRTLGVLHARSFSVELDEVERPSGNSRRLAVRHPSAVSIIPFIGPDDVLLVTQFRYPVGRDTIEFPAGKLDPGEDPWKTAERELTEETGYRAGRFEKLISFASALGYSDEIIHVFAAYDLEKTDSRPDEDEIAKVQSISLDRVRAMILSGDIIDGTTICTLAAYEWVKAGTRPS